MLKDFDQWNEKKKQIDNSDYRVDFHEREIWWCSIGLNIGSEQHSQSRDFSRPVIVLRKFTQEIFLGVPMTTKVKYEKYRHRFLLSDQENDALLMQLRVFDKKRLLRKICTMKYFDYLEIKNKISLLLNKTNTPFGVISEAEANVCNYSIADEICLSNELNYLLSKGEISYSEIPLK